MVEDNDDRHSQNRRDKGEHSGNKRRGRRGDGKRPAGSGGPRRRGPNGDADKQSRPFREGRKRRSGARDSRAGKQGRARSGDDHFQETRPENRAHDRIVGPAIPEGFEERALPFGVRAELRGLAKERADRVAAHIWAAGVLIDEDPALAYEHAETARQLAPRLPVVREAAAETAYAAGEYAAALREYRAIRRMSGGDELIPVMADCERALGRPRDALALLGELDSRHSDPALVIEAVIVEAGVRDDLGQRAEGLRLLRKVASQHVGPAFARARLHYALADLMLADGNTAGARAEFVQSDELDRAGALDTADRIAELDGVILPEDMAEEESPDVVQETETAVENSEEDKA